MCDNIRCLRSYFYNFLALLQEEYQSSGATVHKFIRAAVQRCRGVSEQWCNGAEVYQSSGAILKRCISAAVQIFIRAMMQGCRNLSEQRCNNAEVYQSSSATVQKFMRAAMQKCNAVSEM